MKRTRRNKTGQERKKEGQAMEFQLLAIEPRESLEIIDIHARSLAAPPGRGAYCPWARV
jgi:hypothetical protein